MQDSFFSQNDIRVNRILAGALLFPVPLIPVLAILIRLGMLGISPRGITAIAVVVCAGLLLPAILIKSGCSHRFMKYFIPLDISIIICVISLHPDLDICALLVMGVIFSLLYFDPKLSFIVSVVSVCCTLLSQGIRWYGSVSMKTGAFSADFTSICLMLMICPPAMLISKSIRERMEMNEKLFEEVENTSTRYELALDSSRDVLYEYDIASDEFKYYGSLSADGGGRVKGRGRAISRTPVVVEHFISNIQRGHKFHPDDVSLIEGVAAGTIDDVIQVRMLDGDDYDWFEVESNVIYKNHYAERIVGKVRNITRAKEEEQEFLQTSRKDSLTGFYDKIVGVRMIRRHMTQAGRTDTQEFLYVALENSEEIAADCGQVFLDALLLRLADILKDELSDMDLPVRFSATEFVLYLVNRNPTAIEKMMDRIRQEAAHVYVSAVIGEGLRLRMETYPTLSRLESDVDKGDGDPGYYATEDDSYRNDMVSFAFNLLERTEDFDSAVNLLLDRIGGMYRLDSVRVFRGTSIRGVYRCVYEWRMAEADAEGIPSLLNTDVELGGVRQKNDIFMYECADISEEGGYFLFQGTVFTGSMKERLQDKLSELARIISTFVGKRYADSANRAKSDFLSSMSHEIRTPMNAIAGFAELILQEETSEAVEAYAENIRTSSNNLLGIINDVLDLSKIESGRFEIIPERYYLHDIVDEVRNIMLMQIGSAPVQLRLDIADDICDGLIGDGLRVRQILINLLSNAVKYTASGEVGFELKWKPSSVDSGVLEGCVWDTGIGIREEEIDRIFSAYEQADVKKNRGIQGTGLGLAITKQLIELMNGSIRAQSEYGKGTRFTFTIPQGVFDKTPHDYNIKKEQKSRQAGQVPFVAPWARVLIVDDNRVNLEVAKGLLGKYEVQMETAMGGREAIAMLERDSDFDLIFMDHLMPDLDGIETTHAIRGMGNPMLENIPIVALTANAIKGMEEEFIISGMNGYLAKPIDLGELAKVMDRFIPDEKKELQ